MKLRLPQKQSAPLDTTAIRTLLKISGGGEDPDPSKIKLTDARKKLAATGLDMYEKTNKSGEYSKQNIQNIVRAAKEVGVDPYTALAVSMQETKLGEIDGNLGHVLSGSLKEDKNYAALKEKYKDIDEDALAMNYILKNKLAFADQKGFKDEALKIQAYNGLGKISPQTERDYHIAMGVNPNIMYGLDLSKTGPIDMSQNPLYGKTVIDLRDNVIKQNPDLISFVDEVLAGKLYTPPPPIPKAVDGRKVEKMADGSFKVETDEGDMMEVSKFNKLRGGK